MVTSGEVHVKGNAIFVMMKWWLESLAAAIRVRARSGYAEKDGKMCKVTMKGAAKDGFGATS
jgi:hypothetical protein